MADTSIDVKDTIDIVGLNNIKADLKLELPQPFQTSGSNALEIKPLELKPLRADIGTDTHLKIEPLKLELQIDPLKTDSSMTLDLKPAVIDLCLTANIGKLPNVCIRQPYHHHIGFTLFGAEVWGLTLSGQQDTVIEELDRQPRVAWGGAVTSRPPHRPAHHSERHSDDDAPQQSAQQSGPPTRQIGGLRIRLEP